jgi:protein-S-isoprenylcysteine O-methyltransferase Ste14
MNRKLEDDLGKLAMLLAFGLLAYQQSLGLIAAFSNRSESPLWELSLISRVLGTLFLLLILYFTVTRLPPRDAAEGVMPRIISIAGTFIMMTLTVLPSAQIGLTLQLIATALIAVGFALSILCIYRLGRSFSIMAVARKLVTTGAYRYVRHPLYAAELIAIVGVVLANLSWAAVAIGVLWLALQIKRAQNEEAILRKTFPEYAEYAARVPMLVPGLTPRVRPAAASG